MKNTPASVLARLKNLAKQQDLIYNEVLLRYAVERVLKRLESTPHISQCILKGGTLFLVWNNGRSYRPTMDADLEYRGDGSPEQLIHVFQDVARVALDEDDGLRVDIETIKARHIREDDQYGGVRVTFDALIGTVVVPVQFDVGIGDALTPTPRKMDFPVLLDHEAPRIRVYARETVIAEKFQTIVKRGLFNSRMKDYFDLWVLSSDPKVDPATARLAIERTFKRRETPIPISLPDGLSDDFAKDTDKCVQWNAFLRKNRLASGTPPLIDVVAQVRRFLLPLIPNP